jgi:hypothetical protein
MADEGKSIPFPKSRAADSMEAAVAILAESPTPEHRLDADALKRAKTAGCPAFRGSRVYVDELLAWWEENSETLPTGNSELDAIQLEIAREKLRKARFANDAEEGKFIKREDEAQKILALGLELKATLRRRLEEEYPHRLAGRTYEEIVPLMRALVDELCHDFADGTKRWAQH